MAELKRRNTLKDGIIMIQTLLIILFITVPIFLLLDKVTSGAGSPPWAGQTRIGSPSPGPRVCPLTDLLHHSFTPSVVLTESTSPPVP